MNTRTNVNSKDLLDYMYGRGIPFVQGTVAACCGYKRYRQCMLRRYRCLNDYSASAKY